MKTPSRGVFLGNGTALPIPSCTLPGYVLGFIPDVGTLSLIMTFSWCPIHLQLGERKLLERGCCAQRPSEMTRLEV